MKINLKLNEIIIKTERDAHPKSHYLNTTISKVK